MYNNTRTTLKLIVMLISFSFATAADIYVNQEIGSDTSDGKTRDVAGASSPFKTINRAIEQALPGDIIHIIPTDKPYCQGIEINNKHGQSDKPIIIDGHGVTLSGSGDISEGQYTAVSPGLWRHTNPVSATNVGFVSRYFFVIDGKINRMGQCSKGPCQPFMSIENLKEGQWTYIKTEDAYYIKLSPAKSIKDVKVPVICNMVWIRGDSAYITIRNLNVKHSWNDGFNFYDKVSNIRLENISAIECGDDGFSTHDQCEVELYGYYATRNATGICNTGTGYSYSENVVLCGNNGFEYFLFGPGRHIIKNSLIYADAVQPFFLQNVEPGGLCRVEAVNVTIINTSPRTKYLTLLKDTSLDAQNLSLSGVGIKHSGKLMTLNDSKIVGYLDTDIFIKPDSQWKAANNFYSLGNINFHGKNYTLDSFDQYQIDANDYSLRMLYFGNRP